MKNTTPSNSLEFFSTFIWNSNEIQLAFVILTLHIIMQLLLYTLTIVGRGFLPPPSPPPLFYNDLICCLPPLFKFLSTIFPHCFCCLVSLAEYVNDCDTSNAYFIWWYDRHTFVEPWYLHTRSILLCALCNKASSLM